MQSDADINMSAWKMAQLALNERLGVERVAALHELLDACVVCLDNTDPLHLLRNKGRRRTPAAGQPLIDSSRSIRCWHG